ncbi:MAG TPA: STAS domain-containing protein [Candidatus Baltobacteraceae bacterium]|jgi:anti-sigma B factor antagonist|nr:STAS domain-containing protein [Candidatus Baltobacteraceae bacterium]
MDLRISERKSGNVTILDLRGRIVLGPTNDSLAAELRKLAESAPCNVLINLSEATQVDSSGISTLVRSFVTLERDGGSLKILNPNGHVREILELTRLVQCLPTYTDEAQALASFRDSAAHA